MKKEEAKMLDELLDDDSDRMTDWEVGFIESLDSKRDRELSDRQLEILEKIWDKVFV